MSPKTVRDFSTKLEKTCDLASDAEGSRNASKVKLANFILFNMPLAELQMTVCCEHIKDVQIWIAMRRTKTSQKSTEQRNFLPKNARVSRRTKEFSRYFDYPRSMKRPAT